MDPKYSDLRAKFEHWFEELSRERAAQGSPLGQLEAELRRLDDRLTELERQLTRRGE